MLVTGIGMPGRGAGLGMESRGGAEGDAGQELQRVICSGHIEVGVVGVWPHGSWGHCVEREGENG